MQDPQGSGPGIPEPPVASLISGEKNSLPHHMDTLCPTVLSRPVRAWGLFPTQLSSAARAGWRDLHIWRLLAWHVGFWGLLQQIPTNWGLKTIKVCFLSLGAGSLRSSCQQGRVPGKASWGESAPGRSPSFWRLPAISDTPWPADTSLQSLPVITWSSPGCLHVCMSQRPLLKRTPITGLRASTWLHLQRAYFQIKYGHIHRGCGLGLARTFGRNRIQPAALWVHHSQLTSTRVRLSGSKAETRKRKRCCFPTVFE